MNIKDNNDGTFTFEWDEKDPRFDFLNGKTPEEISKIVSDALEYYLKTNSFF